MTPLLDIRLDRAASTTLAEQIRLGVLAAIESGALAPGARLPSWLTLAAQLGVARGTVKSAYERLADEQVVVSAGSGGTRVAKQAVRAGSGIPSETLEATPSQYAHLLAPPTMFQMGVPSSDRFPVGLLGRLRAHAVRAETAARAVYPDPRGELALKREIAAHLALARGFDCRPSQVFIMAGFTGALGHVLRLLEVEGGTAWMEDPGFFQSRRALELARVTPVPVPVDDDGMDIAHGIAHAPDADVVLVTPGQQAPLGGTLSLQRRMDLIGWAARHGAWIVEDDYLGELQLKRRAAPALASLDGFGRVVHIGSFSKTVSPSLRLGFVVVPPALVERFNELVLCLGSSPGPAVQHAIADFMREGHYMRHLRRMKRIYAERGELVRATLEGLGYKVRIGGLGVLLRLPDGAPDVAMAQEARGLGLGPEPLSRWFDPQSQADRGLLLGVATADETRIPDACRTLHDLIAKHL
jgi:GntR family transcriptional regulator/MocR family aminotransferase